MKSDTLDSSLLSRKRKTAVHVSQDAPVVVSDETTLTLAPADDSAALAVHSEGSSSDSTMRQRHRAASRAHGAASAVAVSLPLPIVDVPSPSTSSLLEADRARAVKRLRLEGSLPKLDTFIGRPQSQKTPSSRPSPLKRRALSLPNIHIRPSRCELLVCDAVESFGEKRINLNSRRHNSTGLGTPPTLGFSRSSRSGSSPPVFETRQSKRPSAPPHIPNIYPLINRETLKELDLETILRNPQLRHDLLLDAGLQFQPTMGRRKRDSTKKYWIAIQRELESGCTCTAFDSRGGLLACQCRAPPADFSDVSRSRSVRLNMPSRIQPLVTELLEVLLSVIAPPPSSTTNPRLPVTVFHHPAHSSQEAQLRAALDPHLIEQELSHGVFDSSGLFTLLGGVLKCHCAPMRDRAVDAMIATAQECHGNMEEATKAIRMCFEILELMKLDIANHQLLALRPYLIASASEFELRNFRESHASGLLSLDVTQAWLQSSYDKLVSASTTSTAASRPTNKSTSVQQQQRIHTAVLHGLIDIVFSPPKKSDLYPETFYMDQHRLAAFSQEASDALVLYMLIMLARQLSLTSSSTRSPRRLESAELEVLKREVCQLFGPERLGRCLMRDSDMYAGRKKRSEENHEHVWKQRLTDVLLQVAARATAPPPPPPSVSCQSPTDATGTASPVARSQLPEKQTLQFLDGWAASNLKDGSPLSQILKTRLKEAMVKILLANSELTESSSSASSDDIFSVGSGLDVLDPELRTLGMKISNLANCHWKIYGSLYEARGFVGIIQSEKSQI